MLTIKGLSFKNQWLYKNTITLPSQWFDVNYDVSILNCDLFRKIITEINGTDVLDTSKAVSVLLILNEVSPLQLCTGVKNLVNCYMFPQYYHRLCMMGENCFKYLIDISLEKDIKVLTGSSRFFTDDDLRGHKVYFEDLDRFADSYNSFGDCMVSLRAGGFFDEP